MHVQVSAQKQEEHKGCTETIEEVCEYARMYSDVVHVHGIYARFVVCKVMKSKKVYASVLSCDLLDMRKEIERIRSMGITALHIDVMDGVMVREVCLGEGFVRAIAFEFADMYIECHLMVCNPLNTLKNMEMHKIDRVIVHQNTNMEEVSIYTSMQDTALGIALSPHERIEEIAVPRTADKILVMGVQPGKGRQKMIETTEEQIKQVRAAYPRLICGVDGGVNISTIKRVQHADEFVLGSCLYKQRNMSNSNSSSSDDSDGKDDSDEQCRRNIDEIRRVLEC